MHSSLSNDYTTFIRRNAVDMPIPAFSSSKPQCEGALRPRKEPSKHKHRMCSRRGVAALCPHENEQMIEVRRDNVRNVKKLVGVDRNENSTVKRLGWWERAGYQRVSSLAVGLRPGDGVLV